jgi:hypothetical protein
MIIFGYKTYSNIKQLHARIRPLRNVRGDNRANMIVQRNDRDLFVMVLTELIAYIILMFLYLCILTEILYRRTRKRKKEKDKSTHIRNMTLGISSYKEYRPYSQD